MECRLIPTTKKEFSRIKIENDDTIIYLGSKFQNKHQSDKFSWLLRGHTVIANIDSLEQVTMHPDDKHYKDFQTVVNRIDFARANYPGSKIYLVDNSQGEISRKVFLFYGLQASTYDKAMLGLSFD